MARCAPASCRPDARSRRTSGSQRGANDRDHRGDVRQGRRRQDDHIRQPGVRARPARQARRRHRLRHRPAQPRPHHGLRAARGVRLRQRDPGRLHAQAGADQGQAHRHAVRAGRVADARQGRAVGGRRAPRARRADRGRLRLHHLRLARRHREGRAPRDVLRRPRGRGGQPGSLLGARLRPHPRPAGQQDAARRKGRRPASTSTCC